jgi:hypothetical protein
MGVLEDVHPDVVAPRWLSPTLVVLVFRDALRIFFRNLPRIALVGVVVFGAATLVEWVLEEWVSRFDQGDLGPLVVAVVVTLILGVGTGMFATLLFAGVLDYTVESELAGRPPPGLAEMVNRIPYLRLLAVDGLIVLASVVGTLLLVIPGMLAFTLLGIAGPLVVAERISALNAIRRSVRLLWPRLGTGIALVLIPVTIADAIEEELSSVAEHFGGAWGHLLAGVVLESTLLAYVALLLTVLAHRLRRAERRLTQPANSM